MSICGLLPHVCDVYVSWMSKDSDNDKLNAVISLNISKKFPIELDTMFLFQPRNLTKKGKNLMISPESQSPSSNHVHMKPTSFAYLFTCGIANIRNVTVHSHNTQFLFLNI